MTINSCEPEVQGKEVAALDQRGDMLPKIYSWSRQLTAESRSPEHRYFWPKEVRQLASALKICEGALIAVAGLQGVGKTSAIRALESDVGGERRVIAFKWPATGKLEDVARLLRMGAEGKKPVANSIPRTLRGFALIMIDTPDYSQTDRRAVTRDLNGIQTIWNGLVSDNGWRGNLVIFIQKELIRGHFFFGKMDVIELKPFQPDELVKAYQQTHGDVWPFTHEALQRTARYSRGVFRRFLRYIQLCLEPHLQERADDLVIGLEQVEEAITTEEVGKDMELELADIFRKEEARRKGTEIVKTLWQKGPMSQTELAQELRIGASALSMFLDRLETHGYVKRERAGKEKLIRANI